MAITLALPLATLARAEQTERLIEEVVVTAKKREQGAYQVPASLSVFGGEELPERGLADLVDIGKFVPNLTVTTFAAGHTSSANPFIRGIGTQDHLITTDPGVGVYVDGVYLGRQVGQHWNLANIERVEVLRGPQGTLYGRNSIGGAVNIVTAPPGGQREARATLRMGSRGRLDAHLHKDGKLSDRLGATLSLGVNRRGGVGEFLKLPNVDARVGQIREVFARLAIAWRPSPDFSLTLAADANQGNNGLNPYTTLIDEIPAGRVYAAGYRNADISDDPYDNNTGALDQTRVSNEAQGLMARAQWSASDWLDVKTITSFRRSKYEAGLDDDGFFEDFLSFPENGEADQSSIEVQLDASLGDIEFVTGVYRFSEEGSNRQEPTLFLGFPGAFQLAQELDSTALFASVGIDLADRWQLAVGARTTRDRKRAMTDVGTGPVIAKRTWRETSWDVSAHYSIGDRLAAYATIQSGYQSGQFPARPYCLFVDPNCFAAGDNITALNYEIGVKGQPMDGLELSAAIFHTRYGDLPYQVSTTAEAGFNTVNLIVGQRTTGFEWESRLYLSDRFSLGATLGWLKIGVDKRQGVRPVAPLTPELTLSLSPEYRWRLDKGAEVAMRIDYSYRDAMWGEPSSDPGRLTRIGSRALVNFYIGYESPDGTWTLALYARNASDERYDHARLNTGDYLLRILSNDASEFGIRIDQRF